MLVVRIRSFLARHRSAHAAVVVVPALTAGLIVASETRRLSVERASWGDVRTVWVAAADLTPGAVAAANPRDLPLALVPDSAVTTDPNGHTIVQRVGRGEVITDVDVAAGTDDGDASLPLPADSRTVAVPIDDQSLAVLPGDRVDVVAGGVGLASAGLVVAVGPTAVTVAVDAASAPLVAAAALDRTAVLVGRVVSARPSR